MRKWKISEEYKEGMWGVLSKENNFGHPLWLTLLLSPSCRTD